jgi:hypothetical protein
MVFGKKEIDDNAAKSKVITRSQTEGSGIYSCTAGDCATNPFTTNDAEEYRKHQLASKRHYQQGVAPCAVCEQEVNMDIVLTRQGVKPIHPECRGEPEEL